MISSIARVFQLRYIVTSTRYFLGFVFLISFLFGLYVLVVPKYELGNFFFGRSQRFYNSSLAKFFYTQSIKFDTDNNKPVPYVHHQLSRVYFIEGNLEKALEESTIELTVYPTHYHTHYIEGLTLGYMGMPREAIEAFQRYIDGNPTTWAARNDKAWLEFRMGKIKEAVATIAPAYLQYPDNPWILNTYGTLLINMHRYEEATTMLNHAQKIVNSMTEREWGGAYPGNDPRIYGTGLSAMKKSIDTNLELAKIKLQPK